MLARESAAELFVSYARNLPPNDRAGAVRFAVQPAGEPVGCRIENRLFSG
jgi:hypothetical protein